MGFTALALAGACCPDGVLCYDDGGAPCGGDLEVVCPPGQYCDFGDGSCGASNALGLCALLPQECPAIFGPVCGCDGNTYGNDCEAAAAGVSVAFSGPCDTEGDACGGQLGTPCNAGEYCRFPIGTCGAADRTGVCSALTDEAVCPEIFAPVCGCDDRTYGNSCEADAAGVSIATEGEC